MPFKGLDPQVVQFVVTVIGVMFAAVAIVLKIYWDNIMNHKKEVRICIEDIEDDINKQNLKIEKVESFMEKSFIELKELQNKNIQLNQEASSKLTIAITKINTTLEYVIKRQEKHEDELDKIKAIK